MSGASHGVVLRSECFKTWSPPTYSFIIRENEAKRQRNLMRAEHFAAAANVPEENINIVQVQKDMQEVQINPRVSFTDILEQKSNAFKHLNMINILEGFVHILYSHRKQPRLVKLNLLYEVGLLVFPWSLH